MIDIELPKISIVVPVYNVEDYLQECLDSLLNQTYPQIEIICVNDGSTDASGEILSDYAGRDERIVVVEQESRGVAGTRNTGLDNATGDIAMFVDSDDRLMPNACETVAAAFLLYPGTDDVIFGANCFDGEFTLALHDVLDVHNAVYDEFDSRVLFEEPSLPFIWKTAYSLDFLNSHRIRFDEDLELGEDLVFQFVALPKTGRTVFLPDKLYD
ncbi:MAG: glycosyltransferase family 2 protein, partial [Coriobacteriales bacterium]